MTETFFLILIPLIAFIYASVGHGGASGYLALMSLLVISPMEMKTIALILNLFVAGVGFYAFQSKGYFDLRLFLSLILGSVPFAFLGGFLVVDDKIFKFILAMFLAFAIVRISGIFTSNKSEELNEFNKFQAFFIGSIIGFFSGLIGIGGGIVLTPVLIIFGWSGLKKTAGISALFIVVNSAAGLVGLFVRKSSICLDYNFVIGAIVLALVGGWLGAKWGADLKKLKSLRYMVSFVLILAIFKLLI